MQIKFEDVIIAPATTPGTGAISIIRLSGNGCFKIADSIINLASYSIAQTSGGRIKFGNIYLEDGTILDEVLVSIFRAPHSYTGEDSVEIYCHASSYIVNKIIELFINKGVRLASQGEFTQRAFINGKMDLAQAESVADLIASDSATAHRVAMNQLKGGFSNELKSLRVELLNITSLVELELDFAEEDVEFADRTTLLNLVNNIDNKISKLLQSFKLGNAIRKGVPVAIVGPANAGKSTLLNALIGDDRAIVSSIAGTTRDTIEETINIDGVQFRFIDTAGIRESQDYVEQIGINKTFKKLSEADIVIAVLDSGMDDILACLMQIMSKVNLESQNLIIVLNKADFYTKTIIDNAYNNIVYMLDKQYNSIENNDACMPYINENNCNKDCVEYGVKTYCYKASNGALIDVVIGAAQQEDIIPVIYKNLSSIMKAKLGDANKTLVTNLRHYEALQKAKVSLDRVNKGIADLIPTDFLAQDLRSCIADLGSILGEINTDEVLENIFKNFCIGK